MRIRPGINCQRPGREIRQVARNIEPVRAEVRSLEDMPASPVGDVEYVAYDVCRPWLSGVDHEIAKVVVDRDAIDNDVALTPALAVILGDENVSGCIGINYIRIVSGDPQGVDDRARFPAVQVGGTEGSPGIALVGGFEDAIGAQHEAVAVGRIHGPRNIGEGRRSGQAGRDRSKGSATVRGTEGGRIALD